MKTQSQNIDERPSYLLGFLNLFTFLLVFAKIEDEFYL